MTMEETIGRINELYHKSQAEGLNEEEKQEAAGGKLPPEMLRSLVCRETGRNH